MKFLLLCLGLVVALAAYSLYPSSAQTQPPNLVGRWKVEFKFSGIEEHSLRLDATSGGKGAFLLLDAVSNLNPPAEPSQAQWEQSAPNKVTFSGNIEFPIGNVGRDPGTLVFKGVFDTASSISGNVSFFRVGQNPNDLGTVPAKIGDFTATRTATGSATNVSAASYNASVASEAIVSAFGSNLAMATQAATDIPLPTSLAGTTVRVQVGGGMEHLAPIFFVSPTQVNYQLPAGTVADAATILITSRDGSAAIETKHIAAVAPGLFSANASGQGPAAALALRVRSDGRESYEPTTRFDPAQNKVVSLPIDLGSGSDQVFLILFGTGIRGRTDLPAVTASMGGTGSEVLFAGPHLEYVGLDQVNLRIPRSLTGRGEIDVALSVNGTSANTVKVNIK